MLKQLQLQLKKKQEAKLRAHNCTGGTIAHTITRNSRVHSHYVKPITAV